jgi:hypothetical protein
MPTKLRIKRLKFISAVDRPAQETATAAIIKRRDGGDDVSATFRFVKADDTLGIAFGWALTSTVDGAAYTDLQGDQVREDELVKVAAEYAAQGGNVDEQHDEQPGAGQCVFLFPMTAEIAKALGIDTPATGLLVGIKLAPDVLDKFKSGAYTGFSIGGSGEREQLDDATPAQKSAAPASAYDRAQQVLKTAVETYQRDNGIRTYEEAFAKATGEDPATRSAYEALTAIARAPSFVSPKMPQAAAEYIKAAQADVSKAELDFRRVVLGFQKAHSIKSYDLAVADATHSDPAAREAYDQLAKARERLDKAPITAATAKLDVEIATLRKSIAEQTESFSIRHNMTPVEARERLMVVSPTYAKQCERVIEAGHERQVAAVRGGAR